MAFSARVEPSGGTELCGSEGEAGFRERSEAVDGATHITMNDEAVISTIDHN